MKYVIALAITAVVAAGALLVALLGAGDMQPEPAADTASSVTERANPEPTEFSGRGTLADLSGRDSIECAISSESDTTGEVIEGTYFVHEGQIRGDFIVPNAEFEEPIVSSIIITPEEFYSWSEISGETYGVKMSRTTYEKGTVGASGEPIAPDQTVTYDCKEWQNIDRSIFEPPGTVLFRDPTLLMQEGMEYGTVYEEGEF